MPGQPTDKPTEQPTNRGGRPKKVLPPAPPASNSFEETLMLGDQAALDANPAAKLRWYDRRAEIQQYLQQRADQKSHDQSAAEISRLQSQVDILTKGNQELEAKVSRAEQLRSERDTAVSRADSAEQQLSEHTSSRTSAEQQLPGLLAFVKFYFSKSKQPKVAAFSFSQANKGLQADEVYQAAGFNATQVGVFRFGWSSYGDKTERELLDWYDEARADNPAKEFIRLLLLVKFKIDVDEIIRKRRERAAEIESTFPGQRPDPNFTSPEAAQDAMVTAALDAEGTRTSPLADAPEYLEEFN